MKSTRSISIDYNIKIVKIGGSPTLVVSSNTHRVSQITAVHAQCVDIDIIKYSNSIANV